MNLSPIEVRVLDALVRYERTTMTRAQVAARLGLDETVLKRVLEHARKTCGVHSTRELIMWYKRTS